jgi:hypothetical protein
MLTCPNCGATMNEGDPCPECDHTDRGECDCPYCDRPQEDDPHE